MGTIWVEFSLISAHGLHHSTSLWKRHWYAVGWIDDNSKYCTKVDDSGNSNPVWRTRFSIPVDKSAPNIQDLALNVEVYSIDPIFFKEKLHGSAKVGLREFLVKKAKNSEVSKTRQEEVQSYRLQKKKSSQPRGFIDILIRISEEKKEESNSHKGGSVGSKDEAVYLDRGDDTQLSAEGGFRHDYLLKQSQPQPFTSTLYSDPYVDEPSYLAEAGPSYQSSRVRTSSPPPPPPPFNVGYIPTFLPINDDLLPSFTDVPSFREAPSQRVPPDVVQEISVEALAAGAVIFGEDFLSEFDLQ